MQAVVKERHVDVGELQHGAHLVRVRLRVRIRFRARARARATVRNRNRVRPSA